MSKFNPPWAIIWRMIAFGVVLGGLGGAIYGPIAVVILYIADVLNGRYSAYGFPWENAIGYLVIAIFVGAAAGVVVGAVSATLSSAALTLGVLLGRGHRLTPNRYRISIVCLCAISSGLVVMLPMSQAVLRPDWFFDGQGEAIALLTLAILPGIVATTLSWWATTQVVFWWEESGRPL